MAKKKLIDLSIVNDITNNVLVGMRAGTEIEKGVVLTEDYLTKNFDHLCEMFSIFSAYPDVFLDLIKPSDDDFSLFFYQRITLRAIMRYREVYGTAPRAFSKSFLTILAMML
jgi:hypothetical protein